MNIGFWEIILTVAAVLLDVVAIACVIWRSQGVERSLTWIFAIIAFPALGATTYFLIANTPVKRIASRKRAATATARESTAKRRRGHFKGEETSLFTVAAASTDLPATHGNIVEILSENDMAFAKIEETVRTAKHSVWVEYYIIRRDETGHSFLNLLIERARAGVQIRLLYDAVGSMGLDGNQLNDLVAAGGQVQAFHPLNPLNPLHRRWSFHLRNHRKLIVVDGEIGFTGGMNVGDEYSGRARFKGKLRFRDSHLMLRGPAVSDLATVFVDDWAFSSGNILQIPEVSHVAHGKTAVAILPSGPDQERNASAMVYFGGLAESREKIYLTSPYFIPDEATLRAMECAALRGIDVRLLVPANIDILLVASASRSYFPALLRAGVRIFEYQPSMLHAKTMVIDGIWGVVGSANLDIRSFRFNFEVSALLHDREIGRLLEERFLSDLNDSREITLADLKNKSLFVLAIERVARLLSPLM